MNDVDVIVLDVDGGAMLQECLSSIERQTLKPNRVIVFDNGSQSPTPHATARSEKNLGFAGGVNAALQYAASPFVALINNDVVLDDDWLETVRNAIDEKTAAIQTVIRRDAPAARSSTRAGASQARSRATKRSRGRIESRTSSIQTGSTPSGSSTLAFSRKARLVITVRSPACFEADPVAARPAVKLRLTAARPESAAASA